MPRKPRDPFDVSLTKEQRTALGNWLGNELRNADAARQANTIDVDYWWSLYEQARTRDKFALPWPDAADLTSYIPCEKVDAVQARIMRTVWTSPLATVEGWGRAAERAPFVEEFHQWKVEEERLQNVLDRVALAALVEPRVLVEVYESSQRRTGRKQIDAKPTTTLGGGLVFNADGEPDLQHDPATGEYPIAQPEDLAITTVVDSDEPIRMGPQYRVLPYEDSLILPGHARDKDEIWGYAKRIWKRKSDIDAAAETGLYDKDSVDRLTDTQEREATGSLLRSKQTIASQSGKESAEKELWEALVLVDLNGLLEREHYDTIRDSALDGERWYVVTIHLLTDTILRWQHDDFSRSRYVPFILFPRHNRATEGYSLVGHKLLTVTEEHTAYRNMAADRSSLAVNAPIKKIVGALWDEDEQPWGPKAVVTVRDHREIEQQQVVDVPASVFQQIAYADRTAERLAGVNDIAAGQISQTDRTLGEVQMATEQSFVRMDLIVRRFQESLEDVMDIRHAIWVRTLAEQPQGVDAPSSMVTGLQLRAAPVDQFMPNGKLTSALLAGTFRFKPYGSVQTADPAKRRNDLLGFMDIVSKSPVFGPFVFQNPQAVRALFRELLQAFNIQNRQAFLGTPAQDLVEQLAMDQMPMPTYAPPMGLGPSMARPGQSMPMMPPPMPPMMPPMGPQGQPPMPMSPMPQGVQ